MSRPAIQIASSAGETAEIAAIADAIAGDKKAGVGCLRERGLRRHERERSRCR